MTLEARLKTLISQELGIDEDEITLDSSFEHDLGADSLDRIEIILCVEEQFGLAIDDDTAEQLVTFGLLLEHVTAAVQRKKGAA